MITTPTLSTYIGRIFLFSVLAMIAGLALLVSLFDFIELLRRAATRAHVGFGVLASIAGLRIPFFILEILPFAVLLGGILAFWRLARSSELVVARASGMSIWQILMAPVLIAVLLGASATFGLSPLSAMMKARADQLDNTYLRAASGPMSLMGGQLWLRQVDRTISPPGVVILHAGNVTLRQKKLELGNVSVFRMNAEDRFLSRIEAPVAELENGFWRLTNAREILPDHAPSAPQAINVQTDLTVNRVQDSFAAPDTLSVWKLPGFISLLNNSGFSSIRHRLRLQALLALPLLSGVMALVAAGFSMRTSRRGGVMKMIACGIGAGFALFIVTKVANEFGQSGGLPVMLAAWAPAGAGLLLAVALLLHLEDG